MKTNLIYFLTICSLLIACNSNDKPKKPSKPNNSKKELKFNDYSYENPPEFRKDGELKFYDINTQEELFKIDTEVASTDESRARGLMFRKEMLENQGMFFLFSTDEFQSFYMRNTLISLDILYVNSKMEIVDIYKNTIPEDETSLPSKEPAKYVIEINAGLCDKYNIQIGDYIVFD
ncbi:MAG: DUF192 domain-containing protein [Bacteroidales bacterium]|jgi:uncharacterized membrane protein (UPF0127 family)|nr:DUF192 domain-containing protein [Bacteroidales bacterium]MCK9499339.1 DUF192 domain-containing protein [Bacteroidales bacterium]MDY0314958.1 DUF192 domain-containing protein [Bacteroidales bacterium]